MIKVTRRRATPDDLEFAFAVTRASIGPYVEMVWGWDQDHQREQHVRRFGTHDVYILVVGDEEVGIVSTGLRDDVLHVFQLFVLPEYQGRGIGAACMHQIMGEAEKRGLPVRLRVLNVNERAGEFYRRLGFREYEKNDTHRFFEKTLARSV